MSFTKKKKATNFDDLVKVVLETAFREIDVDGDGTLDSEELKAVGFSIEVMQRFDTNRDGKLDQSEFVDALSAAVSTKLEGLVKAGVRPVSAMNSSNQRRAVSSLPRSHVSRARSRAPSRRALARSDSPSPAP